MIKRNERHLCRIHSVGLDGLTILETLLSTLVSILGGDGAVLFNNLVLFSLSLDRTLLIGTLLLGHD